MLTGRGMVIAMVMALGSTPIQAAASPAAESTLMGVVTAAEYGLSLSRVSLTLRSESNHAFIQVRATDHRGAFRFDELPAGIYSLEATRAGFERTTVEPILVLEGTTRSEHVTLQSSHTKPRSS
ncbi:MAG TPA: carboxypeptidase regulatory-like domain-containing protein [Deltaproteobacteria bacterium]|nr:carboxypeptidase regulatory-like domain-containing protein [Deltaproteobacteria bacterium]